MKSTSSRYGGKKREEDLALFQNMRMCEQSSALLLDDMEHGGAGRVGALSRARKGSNDLLISDMMDSKNDYDWLLTPPGTPLFPSLDRDLLTGTTPPSLRKPSRLSATCEPQARPLPLDTSLASSISSSSSSSGRPIATRHPSPGPRGRLNTTGSINNNGTHIVNNNNNNNARRPSTPTRTSPSCSSSFGRPSSTPGGGIGGRATSGSTRPSTPTRRSSTPTQRSVMPQAVVSSRPSTPTGRRPMTSPFLGTNGNSSIVASRGAPSSRGTSPMRQPVRRSDPVVSTGPGLRATPERPTSALRSATIVPSSTALARSTSSNRNNVDPRRLNSSSDNFSGRPVTSTNDDKSTSKKSTTGTTSSARLPASRETSFYGTSISKKSLDTAIRHMDIRRSSPSGFRPLVNNNTIANSPSSYPKFSPPIASRGVTSRSNSITSNGSPHQHKLPSSNGIASGAKSTGNELDIFSAAADDNFLLEAGGGLDDLQSCNMEATRAEVARELQILEQQCGHRFSDSSSSS